MKKMYFLLTAALVAMSFSFSSCKKDETIQDDTYSSLMKDDAQTNDLLSEIDNEAEDISNSKSWGLKSAGEDSTGYSGRTVTWTVTDTSKIADITFVNFKHPWAKNERIKNGKIRIVITGKRIDNTYKRVVTFENFTINNNKIEGTKTIMQLSSTTYRISMENGKITFEDNTFITCNSERIRTIIEGQDTPNFWDNVYSLEGTSYGVNRKGNEYTMSTTKAVIVHTNFRFPVEGIIVLVVNGKTITLDYGNGTLDNIAVVTIDGESKEINLRR